MVCRTRRKIDAGVWASGAPGPQSATAGCGGVGLSCQAPHQGVHHDVARLGRSQLSTLLSVVPAPCRVVQGVHVGLAQREGPVRDARRQRGRRAGHELGRQAVAVVAAERWVVRQQVGRLGAALSISGKAWLRDVPHHLCTPAWGTLAKASAFASQVRLAGRLLVLCSLRAAVRGGLSSSVRHDSDLAAHRIASLLVRALMLIYTAARRAPQHTAFALLSRLRTPSRSCLSFSVSCAARLKSCRLYHLKAKHAGSAGADERTALTLCFLSFPLADFFACAYMQTAEAFTAAVALLETGQCRVPSRQRSARNHLLLAPRPLLNLSSSLKKCLAQNPSAGHPSLCLRQVCFNIGRGRRQTLCTERSGKVHSLGIKDKRVHTCGPRSPVNLSASAPGMSSCPLHSRPSGSPLVKRSRAGLSPARAAGRGAHMPFHSALLGHGARVGSVLAVRTQWRGLRSLLASAGAGMHRASPLASAFCTLTLVGASLPRVRRPAGLRAAENISIQRIVPAVAAAYVLHAICAPCRLRRLSAAYTAEQLPCFHLAQGSARNCNTRWGRGAVHGRAAGRAAGVRGGGAPRRGRPARLLLELAGRGQQPRRRGGGEPGGGAGRGGAGAVRAA